jgi:hypothetical protein
VYKGAKMAVGRISGPLLKDNLLRNGVNLAFETSLLYLDVVNSRVGINTTSPQYDLDVNGTTRSTNLYTTTQAQLATFTISGNTIASSSNTINLTPNGVNPTVYSGKINVGNLNLNGNVLSSTNTNGDINITANGTGAINLNSNVLVTGNLHATGNITADGNIQLGDMPTDTISFAGEVNSNILPSTTNTYNLGSVSLQWNNVYAQNVNATNLNLTNFTATSLTTSGTPNLTISGNTISSSGTNADLNFTTVGTGGVLLGNFKFYQNTITNTVANSVTQFTEPTYGFSAYIAPAGLSASLSGATITGKTLTFSSSSGPTVGIGMVLSGGTVTAGTYIVSGSGLSWTLNASQTAGTTCTTASSITMTVTSSTIGTLDQGIYITSGASSNTVITATNSQNSTVSGTGGLGTYLVSPSQTVGSSGSPVAMTGVGGGYVKIPGSYGVVIPVGSGLNRPSLAYTETGMIRFNTDNQYVEVYNGTAWTSVAGAASGISISTASDIALGLVISLG